MVREKTKEKYSEFFKTKFDNFKEYIEYHLNRNPGDKMNPEDEKEKEELEEMEEEYKESTIYIDDEPLEEYEDSSSDFL